MNSIRAERFRDYGFLHLNILVFSITGIFSKLAAQTYTDRGLFNVQFILLVSLMLINCAVYAFFWQKNLKHFEVSIAYSHRSVYNLWSLLWAVMIFGESITAGNIIGIILIIGGVVISQGHE